MVTPVVADLPFAADAGVPGLRRPAVRRATLAATAVVGALAVLVLCFTPLVDAGSVRNGVKSASDGLQVLVTSSWPWLLVLVGAAAGHYLFSALALRAAAGSGVPICLREATRVQVVAAAANRVTPSGIGAVAVNARFLSKCGQTPSRSVGSVGAMHVFGVAAKAGVLLLLMALGGITGTGHWSAIGEGPRRLLTHAPAISMPMILIAGTVLAVVVGIAVGCRARAASLAERVKAAAVQALQQITSMRGRPRDLALLLLASRGTTLMMGLSWSSA